MDSKHYAIVGAGIALATITGVSYAVFQATSKPSTPISQSVDLASPISSTPLVSSPQPTTTVPPQSPQAEASPPAPASESANPSTPQAEPSTQATPVTQIERCVVTMAQVADPQPPLNVRSAPVVTPNNVVAQIPNGTFVDIVTEQDGWFQIKVPVAGWISKDRTRHACSRMMARINFPTGRSQATVSNRFVGTGSHRYLLQASQGQTITLVSQQGPLPFLILPGGKTLLTQPDDRNTRWTGALPTDGDYILELDSNFRGYEYSFSVQVE
ncbi:hypothetical protein BST81_25910 [Leptolyngbya sp. 'hensonii']|uniref:SH3 domain-containing protein n=1 Tax=Leptolyngbya sp. 'hensonii' TaxID=1922337 RepID=UPI00095016BD|nr:SH3 domain-containing protein [Leptolyngbya sp. 'hensonii']OLP15499.1 hypothetical protein BST81_25910 [Leptolyngbya sp. 'hensonii']